jgi:RNA polymerase sigma factor (TIGR02999 family)
MSEVTRILQSLEAGNPQAAEELLPLVYDELRKLAAARMAREKPGRTLSATSLVHEAYVRLVDVEQAQAWSSRGHFFAAAAVGMRRILVEQARSRQRRKRGGERRRLPLEDIELPPGIPADDLLALDEALSRLELEDPQKAQVVQLRFFAGMKHEDVADTLGISAVTARRHWRYARAWLRRAMHGEPDDKHG